MGEQRNLNTQGIILKKHAFGENDYAVTLYSPDLGKIQATAKGARKINGSLNGHIETMNLCNFQLYKSPIRYTIVQCQVRENFKPIRKDFDRAMTANLILEIFHKSTISNEHAGELFQLLEQSLHKIGNCNAGQHFLTVESFKLNLLQQIGALPNLQNCVSCHTRWNNSHQIWLDSGGRLHCQKCSSNGKSIEFNIIKLLHYLTQPPQTQTKNISFSAEQKEQLRHITQFFLQHFLEKEIVSEKILRECSMVV